MLLPVSKGIIDEDTYCLILLWRDKDMGVDKIIDFLETDTMSATFSLKGWFLSMQK